MDTDGPVPIPPHPLRNPERERWICVGTIYRGGHKVVYGRLHWSKCITLTWRGRQQGEDWCQPWQFGDEVALKSAMATRLRMAGLALREMRLETTEFNREVEYVRCRVGRLRRPHSRAVMRNGP
ncbi:MAG: hypothetical protein KGL39_53250 [Patescibacteria group bacterium]|nr:hypothetical protein [Patescibacteria group bacterium]